VGHEHPHAHDHAGHDHAGHEHHAVSAADDRRWLLGALGLVLAFMAVEVVAGLLASSLALLSDAAHMLTDAAAIGLAVVAASLAARPARGRFTFGLGRAEILSAQANGVALLVLAGVLGVEAVGRLAHPADVDGGFVVVVGLLGAAVNVATAWAISRAQRRSLNVEGAMAHVVADLASSLLAALAGLLILVWGLDRADPVASLLVSALMIRSGARLLRAATDVLLEAAPRGIDVDAIGSALAREPGVVEVHDLHVWEVTSGFPALAAHVLVRPGDDCHAVRRRLQRVLGDRFGVDHVTLQVDHAPDAARLLEIEHSARPPARPGPA
jgi:cobalt-zinc-cadmium efflux system protein